MLTLQEIQSQFDHFIDRSRAASPDLQQELWEFSRIVMRKLRDGEAYEQAFNKISDNTEKVLMQIELVHRDSKELIENLKK